MPKLLERMIEFFQNILAAFETMFIYPSVLRDVPDTSRRKSFRDVVRPGHKQLRDLAKEVNDLLVGPLNLKHMVAMSKQLRSSFREKLQASPHCMLPSYNHTLPTGEERGTYLALDVGGSTLRVALVKLNGRSGGLNIVRMSSYPIDKSVKQLEGVQFFDWMAEKIEIMLLEVSEQIGHADAPLPVGLSWSFPIEQTSTRSGLVQNLGKGFRCAEGLLGQDLGEVIMTACKRRRMNLRVDAIINDSSATLLSRAYMEPTTRMALILGTGTNAAVHLPVNCMGAAKFGNRPEQWHARAKNVITNTELSMFGRDILPMTKWDEHLNRTHSLPDFQPLEYMTTGRYLGEIARLIIVEAVQTADLFHGNLPSSMMDPYTLDTALLAILESDTSSSSFSSTRSYLQKHHTLTTPPSPADLVFLKKIARSISHRAAAYMATAVHALWTLRNELDGRRPTESDGDSKVSIACDGSVINKYPGFKSLCQDYIGQLAEKEAAISGVADPERVVLEAAHDATILGAAVAVAVCDAEENAHGLV